MAAALGEDGDPVEQQHRQRPGAREHGQHVQLPNRVPGKRQPLSVRSRPRPRIAGWTVVDTHRDVEEVNVDMREGLPVGWNLLLDNPVRGGNHRGRQARWRGPSRRRQQPRGASGLLPDLPHRRLRRVFIGFDVSTGEHPTGEPGMADQPDPPAVGVAGEQERACRGVLDGHERITARQTATIRSSSALVTPSWQGSVSSVAHSRSAFGHGPPAAWRNTGARYSGL
jgi:hypothetical protein